jgi:hypothetical protein
VEYTDREKLAYSYKNMLQCHFAQDKSHVDSPGIELGPLQYEAQEMAVDKSILIFKALITILHVSNL